MSGASDRSQPNLVPQKVLFLCTGNYYRSRFAEMLFNAKSADFGLQDWIADSRGLAVNAGNPGPIAKVSVLKMIELKLKPTNHERYPLSATATDFETSNLIIALKEKEHRPLMRRHHPAWEKKIEYWHVHDLDCATPEEALPEIEGLVLKLMRSLKSGAKG
jgi:protein-tyrosine phosphatase